MHYFAVFAGLAALTIATPILERKDEATDSDAIAGSGKVTFLSKEVQQAYIDRDGAALANYSFNTQRDYEKLTRTMYDTQLSPFNQVKLDGRVVHFYGDEDTYIWATVLDAEGPEPAEQNFDIALESDPNQKVVHKATVEVGHYSADGGQASSFLVQVPRLTTDVALGLAVGTIVQRSISNILKRAAPATVRLLAAEQEFKRVEKAIAKGTIQPAVQVEELGSAAFAVQEARAAVVAESASTSSVTRYLARNTKFVGGVAGAVGAVVGTLLFDRYVLPHIIQDFVVKVNIVNVDKRAWTVEKWHGDNAIVAGGDEFKSVTLNPPSGRTVPFHPELQADLKEAADVTYVFQNSFNWFTGLGVALQVTSQDPRTGFMVGYDCPYAKDNNVAIQAGIPTSPKDWYDDSAHWPKPKRLNVSDTLTVSGDSVELKAVTDALSGHADLLYHVWVTIGSSL